MAAPVRQTLSTSSSNVFTKPTSLADNDVLEIRYWQYHGTTGASAAPSGFTDVAGTSVNAAGSGFIENHSYRKVVTSAAGEPASYTVTRGAGTNFSDGGEIVRVSGVDTATPENVASARKDETAASSTASTNAYSTSVADCLVQLLIANDGASQTTPTSFTQDFSQDGGDAEGFSRTLSGTISSQTDSSTLGAAQEWGVSYVAIAPPAAGGAGLPFFMQEENLMVGGMGRKSGNLQ